MNEFCVSTIPSGVVWSPNAKAYPKRKYPSALAHASVRMRIAICLANLALTHPMEICKHTRPVSEVNAETNSPENGASAPCRCTEFWHVLMCLHCSSPERTQNFFALAHQHARGYLQLAFVFRSTLASLSPSPITFPESDIQIGASSNA